MDWIAITLLIVAGLVLLALEVYVPGFILGAIGVVLMAVALFLSHRAYGWPGTLSALAVEVGLGTAVVLAAIRFFPESKAGRKMILGASQSGTRAHLGAARDLVGHEGVAHTVLRPTGVAVVDGKRLDVVAESGMIEQGSPIKVVAVQENRLVVRKL